MQIRGLDTTGFKVLKEKLIRCLDYMADKKKIRDVDTVR